MVLRVDIPYIVALESLADSSYMKRFCERCGRRLEVRIGATNGYDPETGEVVEDVTPYCPSWHCSANKPLNDAKTRPEWWK